jgi:signal peptidase I
MEGRMKKPAFFALIRPKKILRQGCQVYRRRASQLNPQQKEFLQDQLQKLQAAIIEKNIADACRMAADLETTMTRLCPKTSWERFRDGTVSLLFALVIAIAIRQVWFEFYRIPSGSMRPTFKEKDYVLVSKTDFGINTLGRTSHFFFDPNLVQRGDIFIFSVENMDVADPDTLYFYLIPGKKQFVKRLIGKPGDSLYFYGGRIYGVDSNGNDLADLRNSGWVKPLEHIPFMRLNGKTQAPSIPSRGVYSPVQFSQMNIPVARLVMQNYGKISGEMLAPFADYYDVWGIKNYAMARLLTKEQVHQIYKCEAGSLAAAPLYLELTHHPSIVRTNLLRDEYRRLRPDLSTDVSFVELSAEYIDEIMRHMTTCRFIVKNEKASRYGSPRPSPDFLPTMKNVENGTYEIQDGRAYRVSWTGFLSALDSNHPLLSHDPSHVQTLFNLGIEMDTRFNPNQPSDLYFPSRYGYFRDGDLYLLGAPIIRRNDTAMAQYSLREQNKKGSSSLYIPFEDAGPPLLADGTLDCDFVRRNGLKIPDGMYLALGDNHAMSADSRAFGFVPQDNLRGKAMCILWPFGSRWGTLLQPSVQHFTAPNLLVWAAFIIAIVLTVLYRTYQSRCSRRWIK